MAPVRRRLLNLRHPRGYIEDTSDEAVSVMKVEPMTAQRATYMKKYADLTMNSKFVLCPRGVTPSSLRLFETMLMGRVPVIISDQWVEPEGPNWNEFSIQVPESEIHRIPDLLAGRESKAQEMARAAREAWENWFSVEVSFHRVVESCRRISTAQPTLRDVVRRYRSRANSSHAVRVTERTINIAKRKYHELKDSLHNNAD